MTREQLVAQIKAKRSFLCVGLDTDPNKLPTGLEKNLKGVLAFNKAIIEATAAYAVSYKLNTAFYEAMGTPGWQALAETLEAIPADCFTILDAKRGDIGNTSAQYAEAMLTHLGADAITVAPYMGHDSVQPFLGRAGKWVILLAMTSNAGGNDFQQLKLEDGRYLYEAVVDKAMTWGSAQELMFVVGATRPAELERLRARTNDYFFLVPGVGAQGGSLEEVCQAAFHHEYCGLLVNSSRQIIYASNGADYASAAAQEAKALQEQMAIWVGKMH